MNDIGLAMFADPIHHFIQFFFFGNNLIILDEPTDGFSAEQLDRLRDVLDLLKIKQVIIVSHESKIESFVDNIIRINKTEHISSVI